MASNDKRAALELRTEEYAEEQAEERTMYLDHGRTLAVVPAGTSQIIEVRASSGQVELRVRMNEDGPILQLNGAKLEVRSEDSIEMACKTFSVNATESVDIASQGGLTVTSEEEMQITATKDVRVRGEKIWLN